MIPRWPVFSTTLPSGREVASRVAPCADPEVAATAVPAVMVHGLGGSSSDWTDLSGELSAHREVHAVDLPGFGFSPPQPDGDYSMVAFMAVVAEYIETTFPGRPVHLFGNSMGGAITVQLAARRPELVATLCLVSPALPELRPRATNVHLPVMTLPKLGGMLFDKYQAVGPARRVQGSYDLILADPSRIPPERRAEAEAEAARRDELPYGREVFTGSIRGLMATYVDRGPDRPWKLAERVTSPALLIYGRQDKLVNPVAAHRATKAFPKADVVVIPDSGHVSQIEHPQLVAHIWTTFLGPQ